MSDFPPVSGGVWYRLDVDGEAPLVRGLIWLRVRDDLPASCAPLSVKLRLTLWTPNGLEDRELDATFRELGAKQAKRRFKRWV